MIEKLEEFVRNKHKDQVRKYTGEPYFNHLLSVAKMADKTKAIFGYEIGLCHDLLEDTDCNKDELFNILIESGYTPVAAFHIVKSTIELTDVFTHEAYPEMNRAKRKFNEAERLFLISPDAQTVKYCDLIDNTKSIVQHDEDFAKIYLQEKRFILSKLTKGDKAMYSKAIDTLQDGIDLITQRLNKD